MRGRHEGGWSRRSTCTSQAIPATASTRLGGEDGHYLDMRSSAGSPELLVFLETKITNAGTDGTRRLIKQVKRAACGFRNKQNYRIRVRLHCTRNNTRMPARSGPVPAQS